MWCGVRASPVSNLWSPIGAYNRSQTLVASKPKGVIFGDAEGGSLEPRQSFPYGIISRSMARGGWTRPISHSPVPPLPPLEIACSQSHA